MKRGRNRTSSARRRERHSAGWGAGLPPLFQGPARSLKGQAGFPSVTVVNQVESLISQKGTVSKFEDPQPSGRRSPPDSSKQIARVNHRAGGAKRNSPRSPTFGGNDLTRNTVGRATPADRYGAWKVVAPRERLRTDEDSKIGDVG